MTDRMPDPQQTMQLDDAGYELIPLHRWDKSKKDMKTGKVRELGKVPVHKNWTTRQSDNAAAIARMKRGEGNVGVRLRATDLVIDWDPRNDSGQWGVPDYDEFILRNGLDPTNWPTVRTGSGGLHHYLTKPSDIPVLEGPAGFPGVEFKTRGRQTVAPGSIHPNGNLYDWIGEPLDMFNDAPDAPDALIEVARKTVRSAATATAPGVYSVKELALMLDVLEPENFRDHSDWLEIMMACHHATGGCGREEFIEWSTLDPLYVDDASAIADRWDSLDLGKAGGITYRTLDMALTNAGRQDTIPRPDAAEDFDDVETEEPAANRAKERARPWPTRLVYEVKHGAKNARHFLGRRPRRVLSSDGIFYDLREGVWEALDEAMLKAEIRATDPTDILDVEHVSKMVKGVSDLRATDARPFDWIGEPPIKAAASDLVLFRNGLLDLRTNKLHEFDGSYFATGLPDHSYDLSAQCPTWMSWLDQVLDASYHSTLQEWMGYLMTADVRAHRFMNLIGVKRGGKSTAAHICKALVGKQHSHSSALSGLGESFGLEPCLDKRLLIIPDAHDVAGSGRTLALERIKMITGGDEVDVNRKNRSVLQVPLPTKLMVVANKMPKFIDESGALAARMLIVRFDTSFLGREDRNLGAKLMEEMPGIANWALKGLSRLRENSLSFTVGEAGHIEAATSELGQSPALRFATDRLEVTGDEEHAVPMNEIYSSYRDWIFQEGLSSGETRNQTDLALDICAALPNVRYRQRRVKNPRGKKGKQTYCLTGVSGVAAYEGEDFED
ncbi:phage/plasmid primase, P4 family [Sulfitobacter sp.]|uniref:phage/plasmid primase, P4 family n=1 Tax=Sulfitobacter sp. TaxID=1903071 RepID=UPI003001AC5F